MSHADECTRLPDVQALWDGDLPAEAADDLQLHLRGCAQCAAEYRGLERFNRLLRDADPAEPLPPVAVQRLREALVTRAAASLQETRHPEASAPRSRSNPLRPWFALLPGAAAAAIWLLLVWPGLPARHQADAPEVRPPVDSQPSPKDPPRPVEAAVPKNRPEPALKTAQSPAPLKSQPQPQPAAPKSVRRPAPVLARTTQEASIGSPSSRPKREPSRPAPTPEPVERIVVVADGVHQPAAPRHATVIDIRSSDPPGARVAVVQIKSQETP